MKMLKDSSEIKEAAKLFEELLAESAVVAPIGASIRKPVFKQSGFTAQTPVHRPAPDRGRPPVHDTMDDDTDDSQMYRGDRLESALFAMCRRGGFHGSLIVDSNGLPLAVYNSPVEDETIAAVTTILGEALDKAGRLMKQNEVHNISMDTSYVDKAVIRRFFINDLPYFLMVICPQEVDERAEVELSIEKVISILKKA